MNIIEGQLDKKPINPEKRPDMPDIFSKSIQKTDAYVNMHTEYTFSSCQLSIVNSPLSTLYRLFGIIYKEYSKRGMARTKNGWKKIPSLADTSFFCTKTIQKKSRIYEK